MIEVRYSNEQNIKATTIAAFIKAVRPHEDVRIRLTRRPVDSHLVLLEADGETPRRDICGLIPSLTARFAQLFEVGL